MKLYMTSDGDFLNMDLLVKASFGNNIATLVFAAPFAIGVGTTGAYTLNLKGLDVAAARSWLLSELVADARDRSPKIGGGS